MIIHWKRIVRDLLKRARSSPSSVSPAAPWGSRPGLPALPIARRGGESLSGEEEPVAGGVDTDDDVLVVPVACRHGQVLEADLQFLPAGLD